jgi:hypothetical protein
MVPTWKTELDALVRETMAFAASVAGKKLVQPKQVDPAAADITVSGGAAEDEIVHADPAVLATVEAVLGQEPMVPGPLREETKASFAKLPPISLPPSERDEIKQRLAGFKAHQLKMQAEREDYYLQTMTRTRALAAGSLPAKDQ